MHSTCGFIAVAIIQSFDNGLVLVDDLVGSPSREDGWLIALVQMSG